MNPQQIQTKIIAVGEDPAHSGYNLNEGKAILSAPSNKQLAIHSVQYCTIAASEKIMLAESLPSNNKFWTWNGTAATEITSAINAGTETNIVTTTAGHGFIVQNSEQFTALGITVTQIDGGATGDFVAEYWNGSAWKSMHLIIDSLNAFSVYAWTLCFAQPLDWAVGAGSTGADNTLYSVRIRTVSAGTSAIIKATSIRIGKIFSFGIPNAAGGTYSIPQTEIFTHPYVLSQGSSVMLCGQIGAIKTSILIRYKIN